jgi:hypothetical protein
VFDKINISNWALKSKYTYVIIMAKSNNGNLLYASTEQKILLATSSGFIKAKFLNKG